MAPSPSGTSSRPHFRDDDSHDEDQNEKLIGDAGQLVELGLSAPVGDVDSNRKGERTRRHGHRPDPGAKPAADRYLDAQQDQGQAVHGVGEALHPQTVHSTVSALPKRVASSAGGASIQASTACLSAT